MAFDDCLKCSVLIVFVLRISQGLPATIADLKEPRDLRDAFRQAKSQEMLKYLNETADPCEDFYEFTCGNYSRNYPNVTAAGALTLPSLPTMFDVFYAKLRLELAAEDPVRDSNVDRQVKTFYKSCLKVTSDIAADTNKVFAFFKGLHNMPLLKGDLWQGTDFDWVATAAEMVRLAGISTIFGIGAVTDYNDNTVNRVGVFEPKFCEDGIHLFANEEYASLRELYITFIAYDLRTFLGVGKDEALEAAKEILGFEIALAQGKVNKHLGLQNCDIFNLTTIDEVQRRYSPDLDIRKLLSLSLEFVPQELYVNFHYLDNTLKVVKATPKRVVANYMYSTFIRYFIFPHLLEVENLEEKCVMETHSRFYKQLDNMLYRKAITVEMKDDIYAMWQELKSAFTSMLKSPKLNWLQGDTRSYALEKLNAMKFTIQGYEGNNFEQEFAHLNLSEEDYLENLISFRALRGNRTRAEIHEPPLPEDEGEATSISPSYSPIDNLIKMPVDHLQQYFQFSSSYPNAVKFGTMGSYIGHEILHGFDDAGRRYDIRGNSRNWWDAHAANEFRNRTKCFINQYKKYTIDGRPLPEMQMQAENIADNGGIRTAYQAYLNWYSNAQGSSRSLEMETLAGLNYTNKQLFFISYGQAWCTLNVPDYDSKKVATDTHVPSKFRVIGPLSNFEEFSKAFSCPRGSGMNPVEKCEIY